jgi:hypothetical protein
LETLSESSFLKNQNFLKKHLNKPLVKTNIHNKNNNKPLHKHIHKPTHNNPQPVNQTPQKSLNKYINSLLSKTKIKFGKSTDFSLGKAYLGFFIPLVDKKGQLIFQHSRKFHTLNNSQHKQHSTLLLPVEAEEGNEEVFQLVYGLKEKLLE